jgi:hypothetical protein
MYTEGAYDVELVRPFLLHCRCDVILAGPVSTRRPERNVGGRSWLRSLSATVTDLGELVVLQKLRNSHFHSCFALA